MKIPIFHLPLRKDRHGDSHGGVIIYDKNNLHFKHRADLEPNNLECLWVEITLRNNKNILFGNFYRPPNAASIYNSLIETLSLAVDTGFSYIFITGDFNYNTQNRNASLNIASLCRENDLVQLINKPTHFTENSNSTLDYICI
jgi:hypothetical protein